VILPDSIAFFSRFYVVKHVHLLGGDAQSTPYLYRESVILSIAKNLKTRLYVPEILHFVQDDTKKKREFS